MTGDASVNRDAPVLCCTAEVLAQIALTEGDKAGIALMDEFHYYGDAGAAFPAPAPHRPGEDPISARVPPWATRPS